jgi:hypothetical protein
MKVIFSLFKKHPVGILFLFLYAGLCVEVMRMGIQYQERRHAHPGVGGMVLGGEGMAYACFFWFIIGCLFFLVNLGYASCSKTESKFYGWLILIIVVETFTTLNFV